MTQSQMLELLPNVHILIFSAPADAKLFSTLLTEKATIPITTCSAQNAQQVEAVLREQEWDLIVWDCALSVLPTAAAIQRIQILQPETPILLVTDDPTVQETVDLMLMGARGVVTRENAHRLVDLVWQELAPRLKIPADIDDHVGPIYASEQELRRARARAETSEQILRETQKVAEVGYWELDLVQNRLHWSEDVYTIIGCPPEEFNATYEAFLEFVHPDDRQWVDTAYTHHLTTKQQYDIVHRVITPDGQLKYVRERCQTTFDAVGIPLRSLGVMADVTQIKLTAEALRESRAHQDAILKAIPDLMFCIKTDGTFVDYHAPSDDQLALPPEMFIGKKAQDILPPEIAQKQMAAMERVMATQQPTQYEYSLTIQGHERKYEARLVSIGNSDEMLAFVRDVTEQRGLDAAQRTREEKYRSLIESTDAVISLVDGDGRYLYLNPMAAIFYGKKPEELVGKHLSDLFIPADTAKILADVQRVIRSDTGKILEQEVMIAGKAHWFHTSIQPVRDARGNPYAALLYATEITDKKQAE